MAQHIGTPLQTCDVYVIAEHGQALRPTVPKSNVERPGAFEGTPADTDRAGDRRDHHGREVLQQTEQLGKYCCNALINHPPSTNQHPLTHQLSNDKRPRITVVYGSAIGGHCEAERGVEGRI